MSEGLKPLPEDVRLFIHDVTLFIQSHRSKTEEQMDDMFQKAYVLYSKYDVENVSVESRPEPRQDWNEEAINKIFHEHSTLGFDRFVKKYGTSNIAKSLIQHFKPAAIAGLEKIAFSLANDIQGLYNLEIGVVSDIEAIILKELSKLTPPAKNDILMPSHLHGARKEDDCTIASPAKVVWPEKMEYVGGASKSEISFYNYAIDEFKRLNPDVGEGREVKWPEKFNLDMGIVDISSAKHDGWNRAIDACIQAHNETGGKE